MPELSPDKLPAYRKHRASGQAIVTLNGVDHYLGPHGTKASKLEYDRLIGEWITRGRTPEVDTNDVTVVELLAAFRRHAIKHYRKDGRPTGELANIDYAIKTLKTFYGRELVGHFGPLKLQAIQAALVRDNLARSTTRTHTSKSGLKKTRWLACSYSCKKSARSPPRRVPEQGGTGMRLTMSVTICWSSTIRPTAVAK